MISLKPDVDIRGMQPEMIVGLMVIAPIINRHGAECVVTACKDGKHKEGSLHYKGLALDIRSKTLIPKDLPSIVQELKLSLGPQFDVVLEGANTPGASAQHIHVEYDPKVK
jgi:hypothetical protein